MRDEPKPLTREAVEELEALIIDAKSAAEWSWKFPELFATLAAKEEEIERLRLENKELHHKMNTKYWDKCRDDNTALRKRIAELEAASSDDKYCAHCNAILLTDKSCPVCTRSKRIAELEGLLREGYEYTLPTSTYDQFVVWADRIRKEVQGE